MYLLRYAPLLADPVRYLINPRGPISLEMIWKRI